jgi:hypothetical protein
LSYISLLTPACFWIPFARSIIFHPSIFSLCIPLQVKWISGRQHTVGFIYLFIYLLGLGLNSGLAKPCGTLPLEPHLQPILLWLFWEMESHKLSACVVL